MTTSFVPKYGERSLSAVGAYQYFIFIWSEVIATSQGVKSLLEPEKPGNKSMVSWGAC